jgi:hypothetical protein
MKTINYHLGLNLSENKKTGPIYVSTSSQLTCWEGCAFFRNGCYASGGKVAIHWGMITKGTRGGSFADLVARVASLPRGELFRHNQAGDLPGRGAKINRAELRRLTKATSGLRAWTYTHKPVLGSGVQATKNREAVKEANKDGFVINLSGNTLSHADELAALGIAPVVVVIPEDAGNATQYTPGGRKVVVCPEQTQKPDQGITCKTCQLCARGSRSVIIGFLAHGASHKKASNVARGEGA